MVSSSCVYIQCYELIVEPEARDDAPEDEDPLARDPQEDLNEPLDRKLPGEPPGKVITLVLQGDRRVGDRVPAVARHRGIEAAHRKKQVVLRVRLGRLKIDDDLIPG